MNQYNNPKIIPINTVMNATINSTACQLLDSFVYSIQIFFTGTPTGSFKLQMSDDQAFNGKPNSNGSGLIVPPTHWTDIANSSLSVSAAGDVGWDYSWPGFVWVRVVYTDTSSGSSTAIITSATFNAKGN